MHALESRVPPVVVALSAALLMWLISWAGPVFRFIFPWGEPLAAGLAIAGAVTSGLGVLSFRCAGTTVNPIKPNSSSDLVASGVYMVSRNPMYLGFLLILVAWAIFLSNILVFLLLPAFAVFINRFQIEPEERALTAMFGQKFVVYDLGFVSGYEEYRSTLFRPPIGTRT